MWFSKPKANGTRTAPRGRAQTPAETVLRLLLSKHVRNWSFDTLEREVTLNLANGDFARIGLSKVPDAKTLARIAQALGGEVIAKLHQRLVTLAQEHGIVKGRKMRVDTVVETNIHYPTDSSLLGGGARVLSRTMKKIENQAGKLKRKIRDRTRSVNKSDRYCHCQPLQGRSGEQKRKKEYRGLLRLTRQILNDTKRAIGEIDRRRNTAYLGGFSSLQDPNKRFLERSPSQFDVPQNFQLAVTYDPPWGRDWTFGTNWSPWLNTVAAGGNRVESRLRRAGFR